MRKIHTISQNLNAIKIIPSEIWLLWSFPFTNFKNFQNHAVQIKRKNFHCTEKGVLTSFMVKTAFNSAFKAFVLYLQTNKWLHICNLQIALLGLFASCLYFCVSIWIREHFGSIWKIQMSYYEHELIMYGSQHAKGEALINDI